MSVNHRILVVDDDPDIIEVLQTAIENEGLHVETANDGLAALTLLELDIDLVDLCVEILFSSRDVLFTIMK